MKDEAIYRCVHAACARSLPRRVNFCPYCGTAQHEGAARPAAKQPEPLSAAPAPRQPAPVPVVPPVVAPVVAPPAARPGARSAQPVPTVQRKPVRLRYWLLVLAALWLVWMVEKPDTRKIDARIDKAVALASACRLSEAQSELIALESTKATPAQLERLQAALGSATPACEKKRQRPKPKAAARPRADSAAARQAESARNLIADAERDIASGDYKAAIDKMDVCAAMVDAGHRDCAAVSGRASRLQQERQRCLAGGGDWGGGRCW